MAVILLEAWKTKVAKPAPATILPDGCRDLIFYAPPAGRPRWMITALDNTAYQIDTQKGGYFKGFRLQPGTIIDPALLVAVQGKAPDDGSILDRLHSFTTHSTLVQDALDRLNERAGNGGTVEAAARGIGLRRMQQALRQHTGRPPAQWLALARVRKAARQVLAGGPLADVAAGLGYADQPHMTRAFTRWLGTSPARLPGHYARQLGAPGYG